MITMLNFARLQASIRDEILGALQRVLDTSQFILGPELAAFEQAAAEYLGVRYAIGVSSGTAALELALKAIDVRGSTVLTTSFSFAATATAILAAGAQPVFVDIDPHSYQMDVPKALAMSSTVRPKVIVPVHLYGQVLDIEPLRQWAAVNGAYVVEDAAQAFGARQNGRNAGTVGDIGCYSFFPTKNLGGIGDGGLAVTNDPELAGKLRRLREPLVNDTFCTGATNARLDGVQAAVLSVKLRHLDEWNARRREHAARYSAAFGDVRQVVCPQSPPGSIVHQYTLRVTQRDELLKFLASHGIEARVYYRKTLPDYVGMKGHESHCPQAVVAAAQVISLPVSPCLMDDEQQQVIDAVRGFYGAFTTIAPIAWRECGWRQHADVVANIGVCTHPRVHVPNGTVTADVCRVCEQPPRKTVAPVQDRDREEGPSSPRVRTWAVGMTTAPRGKETLARSLTSLRGAGWERPRLFVEPNVVLPKEYANLSVSQRDEKLGAFPNWLLGLAELVLREPQAEAYFICQDDVLFTPSSREYLERTLWPGPEVGVVSLYCPSHFARGLPTGFHAEDRGWDTWGALAYVFPNPSARALLADPHMIGHRHHGPAEGLRNIDSVVGNWCQRAGRPYYVHTPSLAQHIGDVSTIWSQDGNLGPRRATTFLSGAPPTALEPARRDDTVPVIESVKVGEVVCVKPCCGTRK